MSEPGPTGTGEGYKAGGDDALPQPEQAAEGLFELSDQMTFPDKFPQPVWQSVQNAKTLLTGRKILHIVRKEECASTSKRSSEV